ncbi:hypothetical protein CR513_32330, partial [Mucuna pruriens]
MARFLHDLNRDIRTLWSYMITLLFLWLYTKLLKLNLNVYVPNSNTHKSSNIKYFKYLGKGYISSQCPNKRAMINKD